jgi:hypothetical protein
LLIVADHHYSLSLSLLLQQLLGMMSTKDINNKSTTTASAAVTPLHYNIMNNKANCRGSYKTNDTDMFDENHDDNNKNNDNYDESFD